MAVAARVVVPRQPRPEEAGGFFHISARAIRREPLFLGDHDRCLFLLGLGEVVTRQRWHCLTYCLMSTHYHVVVATPEPNLGEGMRRLNGRYAESFNRRYRHRGHALGGRFWSEPIRRDEHLLEALRYVALNPVRAGLVARPEDWRWSAHRHLLDHTAPPSWLDGSRTLGYFQPVRMTRRARYERFVEEGLPTARRTDR